ncbi:MAG: D-glycero-beta-D-manno-heptose-7-phosphate kinase [Proteobacteria bacterium]|nr:D-glycero-beta-D-manno-heptose-7-phosphate kinase [Pseudomonadota bacterium]
MTSADLPHRLEALQSHSVLVVGDLMLDRFIYGQVERISPEAPIPVLRFQRETAMLGGAGNVVRNLISLGQKAELIAAIGSDPAGFEIAKMLSQEANVTPHLLSDPARPTTIKSRYIAGVQQVLRCDHERTEALDAGLEEQAIMRLKMALPGCTVVILSDYAKGVLTPKIIRACIDMAHEAKKPVIIDPKIRDYALYQGADVITPNRKELAEASNMAIASVDDAVKAAQGLIKKYSFGAVLAKLGGDGVCLVRKSGDPVHVAATAREVYDVSGAGDTVVAAFATGLAAGMSMEQAAHLANEAGSLVVGKIGTATVTVDELVKSLRQSEARELDDKIMPLAKAQETVERWRRQGLTIGFTNGCFDLLHPGHISLLQQSRKACDRLVVGLNSDDSIKRLKGEGRPVQNVKARSIVLASLAPVDLVVVFEEDTPIELIRALRPGVLVKGADYTMETVVGAKDVTSWGGKVILADLVEGQSTTGTIKKLRQTGS